jgi:hypothetical protein
MKNLFFSGLFYFACIGFSNAQIECIQCFTRMDPISPDAVNLIQNGGFEDHNCIPAWFQGSYCPGSNLYNCDIEAWRCIGGGTNSYPIIFDSTLSRIPEGEFAAYFGNGNAFVCAEFSFDTSCIARDACTLTGFPTGFPTTLDGYGGPEGVSLEQTVDNFIVGETYILEFWAGGEPLQGLLLAPGVFAIDIGFGKTYLTCQPTTQNQDPPGTVYLIRFTATSPTHTITFTNWGHMCIDCTELVLDNVRLYTLAELAPPFQECMTSTSESSAVDDILIYPNPADNAITVKAPGEDHYWITVLDAQGRMIAQQSSEREVALSGLQAGIYFLLLEGENGIIVKRMIKI